MSDDKQPVELTALFKEISNGSRGATERLFEVVYGELRRMAHGRMVRERPGQTLQTTALVNEAYLKLCGNERARFENRRHFFGAAARAMRQILVDKAKEKQAQKREGSRKRVTLEHDVAAAEAPLDLIALDEALDRLARENERAAEVVKHRYFLGLTVNETAEVLTVSPRTVDSDWQLAKAWLRREITRIEPGDSP